MGEAIGGFLDAIRSPGAAFGPHPFWFWNDDLDEDELLRQLHAFHEAGIGGVVIHPRIGLSRRVGYLTEEYFRLVKRVVDECALLDMNVVLYDEGSYPSGSACGRVVAENPEYAARSLALVHEAFEGPHTGYWRPHLGRSLVDRLVCVTLARADAGAEGELRIAPETLRLLQPGDRGLVRLDVGPGRWIVMACIDTPSGGTIRGVYPEQESGMATSPPAGDLMNPDAVDAFVRLTHDAYFERLGEHFGTTIVAMFTDEPSPLGRGARRNVRPFTRGFETWLGQYLHETHPDLQGRLHPDVRAWLPALWLDYGPRTSDFREAYEQAVHRRVIDVFYGAQSTWCKEHGISLTGHPAGSHDMATLRTFDWPGQDMVWRWVKPGDDSGLEGEHSVAPKAATSAARAGGRRRIVSELLGAYGWRLSLDEVKWLVDWHFVRGNNLLMPHAFFYSVRDGRAFESEPDLGLHNAWWPYFKHISRYIRRMSWLLTDCVHMCDVAVLGQGRNLPWRAASTLQRCQIDFLYIDEHALERARVDDADGRLRVGEQAYRVVVVDGEFPLPRAAVQNLEAFRSAGGTVVMCDEGKEPGEAWVERVRAASKAAVRIRPADPDLRVMRVKKAGVDVYLLSNEGESTIDGELELSTWGRALWYDPLWGTEARACSGGLCEGEVGSSGPGIPVIAFELDRRETRLLLVEPGEGDPSVETVALMRSGASEPSEAVVVPIESTWRVRGTDGSPVGAPAPGDWTKAPELECFSGTLCYQTQVVLPAKPARIDIDLGGVGEIAEVVVNGACAGIRMWSPYRFDTPGSVWRAGANELGVRVTNSSANAYEGAMRPSGLIGPVALRIYPG